MADKNKKQADRLAAVREVVADQNAHPSGCACETCKGLAQLAEAEAWLRDSGQGQGNQR